MNENCGIAAIPREGIRAAARSKMMQGKAQLNLSEQPPGIYLLHIQSADGAVHYQKLVKE